MRTYTLNFWDAEL